MKETPLKFQLLKLEVVEEEIDHAFFVGKSESDLYRADGRSAIYIGFGFIIDENKFFVDTGIIYSNSGKDYLKFTVRSLYRINNLQDHIVIQNDTPSLKNKIALYRLVDNSIAHLRGIFNFKFADKVETLPVVPFMRAKNILRDEFLMSMQK